MPRRIQFTYGHSSEYTYDASGVKRKVYHVTVRNNLNVPMGTTTATNQSSYISSIMTNDYCGHIIYENNQVKQILTPEGYLTKTGASYDYHFYLRDHLGNNRSVLKWDGAGNSNTDCAVVQETNYYPSGMEYERWYPGDSYNPGTQPYKYGDKELQDMHGLKWYDYDARHRDNFIPVFTTRDPLAHEYPNISPYAYCLNNPLRYIDPDGRNPVVAGAVVLGTAEVALISLGIMTTGYLVYRAQNGNISFTPRVTNMFRSSTPSAPTQSATKPSPGLSNQRKKEREAKEGLDKSQANVQQTVVNGGHNPQDPGGDFNPNNPKPSPILKAVAGTVAGSLLVEQINSNDDDSQEQQSQEQQSQPEPEPEPAPQPQPQQPQQAPSCHFLI